MTTFSMTTSSTIHFRSSMTALTKKSKSMKKGNKKQAELWSEASLRLISLAEGDKLDQSSKWQAETWESRECPNTRAHCRDREHKQRELKRSKWETTMRWSDQEMQNREQIESWTRGCGKAHRSYRTRDPWWTQPEQLALHHTPTIIQWDQDKRQDSWVILASIPPASGQGSSTKFLKSAYLPSVVAQNHTKETRIQETPQLVQGISSAGLHNSVQAPNHSPIPTTITTDSPQTQSPDHLQLKSKH